ncbi:hypothetical protein Metlim_1889 [Methanoplanus limicola DSM 2279]|uniref:Uncharacterized protein n=1 Tax=Methanoplanus limicola DSM 2279 TaxID=937775 RepID=H1YYK6_9EURY|nr:hypothetical protein Metlim_1889 [Methanoplanus limicola DSM 2279]
MQKNIELLQFSALFKMNNSAEEQCKSDAKVKNMLASVVRDDHV